MIWSIFMHAIMGYFGTTVFTWTTQGILIAIAVALATQGVNLFQLKRDLLRKAVEETDANHQRAVMEWKESNSKERGKGKGNAGPKPEKVAVVIDNMKQVLLTALIKNTAICSAVTLLVSEFARSKHVGL
jgi:adenine/guanine phosphoribosyltransferase-like PRPP-binding protein